MRDKYFKCPECGKMTRHIRLSSREFAAMREDYSSFDRAGSAFCDFIGITQLMNLSGICFYKCAECGRTCTRNGDGTDITDWEGKASLIEEVIGKKFPWNKD